MDSTQNNCYISPDFVKTATVAAFGIATCAAVVATSVATGGVALVVFAVLAGLFASGSVASVSAWIFDDSGTIEGYFDTFKSHLGKAIAFITTYAALSMCCSLISGMSDRAYVNALTRR